MTTFVAHQDCFQFISSLPDSSISLLLTDPPYMGIVKDSWDNQWESSEKYVEWMMNLFRLIKPKMKPNGSVIFFGGIGKHGERPFFKLMDQIEKENLFHYRNLVTWKKKRAYGKMLSLDTELPTPNGFMKLANLKEGDSLFDETGQVCKITKLHPIDKTPTSFRITFDDGSRVDACGEHLWSTHTKQERKKLESPKIRTTQQIMDTLKTGSKQESNHSVLCCQPVQYPTKKLPIDPYLLGLWLGDGTSQSGCITSADPEILHGFRHWVIPSSQGKSKAVLYRVKGLTTQLNKLGMLNNKHIPAAYMHSDISQRMALLQGLMDTDGSCGKNGQTEFSSSNEKLASQVVELMLSLGFKTRVIKRASYFNGKQHKDSYRIWCMTDRPIFRLPRKLERINIRAGRSQKARSQHRYIVNVEAIPPIPMRCITVDSPNNLFLVSRNFIPTHNSHDYLFCREEIAWYSISPVRTEVTFNIPLLDEKRGYAGWDKNHPAKSEFKRVSNVWTDIPELFRPKRNTQKPLPLMQRLIATHSNPGDLVVDPFCGYGSTGLAAISLGRSFLGSEAIKEDAEAANARCEEIANGTTKFGIAINGSGTSGNESEGDSGGQNPEGG